MRNPIEFSGWFSLASSAARRKGRVLLRGFILLLPTAGAEAQLQNYNYNDSDLAKRAAPYPPYRTPEPREYNLKRGRLTARFDTSLQTTFTDNIELTEENREADFVISPVVNLGFLFPVTEDQLLRFDIGLGYRWYVDHTSLSSVYVVPNSHVSHRMRIHDVWIEFYDDFGVQLDPTARGDLSGSSTNGAVSLPSAFRRFVNTAGLTAAWQPVEALRLRAAYNFNFDTSLSGEYTYYDRNEHNFLAGADYIFSPRLSVGLNTSFGILDYHERIQNDGTSLTIGPTATWRLTKVISIDSTVGYSIYTYDSNGSIGDQSDFSGITFRAGIRHELNKRVSHGITASRSILPGLSESTEPGLGSNFTDLFNLEYAVRTRLTSTLLLNTALIYEKLESSGALRERADRYIVSLGTGFQISRNWIFGVAYMFAYKDSDLAGHDYTQNRVTLDFARHF